MTTGSPAAKTDIATRSPDFAKLATDLVAGTPFEALGKAFMPGTSTIKPPTTGKQQDDYIIKPEQVVSSIKVPTYTPPPVPTGAVSTVAQPKPQTQTGSTAPQTGSSAPQRPEGHGY